jgi:menaquinone-dependent protoporphyrinogen oxidase
MAKLAIIYATSEGQTRKIAEHIAGVARGHGHTVEVVDVKQVPKGFALEVFDAAIIGASIHAGQYPAAIVDFCQRQRPYLSRTPSAFYTVCLTAKDETPAATAQVHQYISQFQQATGWQPAKVGIFAGALLYRQYGFLKRFVMRRIAKGQGGETDTSRDWEYTDWAAVTRFAEDYFAAVDWTVTPFAMA